MTSETSAPTPAVEKKLGLYRRFYNWVLHWAYTAYAQPALFILSFTESSFFPIPPDALMLPMCLSNRARALRFAFVCSLGSVLGGMFGFWLGSALWNTTGVAQFFFDYVPGFTPEQFDKISKRYDEYAFVAVFAAGFTPIPYKVFTIAAGACNIDFWMFVLASAVSRSTRFYLEAILLRVYGEPVKEFIDRRLGLVTIAFCVILIGGFYLIKHVL